MSRKMRKGQRKLLRSEKKSQTNMKPRDRRKMLKGKTTEDTTMMVTTTIDVITVIIATRSKDTKRKTPTKTKEVSHMEKVAKRSVEIATTIEMTETKSKIRRKLSLKRSPKKTFAKRSRRTSKSSF